MKQLTTKNKLKIINKLKIMCWSALILAFLLKILGVYYIDKGLNVDWLINLDNFVSKHRFIEIGLNYISDTFITFMIVLIVNRKARLCNKDNLIVWIISTLCYILRVLLPNISIISDITTTFILPIIICKNGKPEAYLRTWVVFLLMNIFQIISIVTRLDTIEKLNNNAIYYAFLSIDYYIMFILYYVYSSIQTKGDHKNGRLG